MASVCGRSLEEIGGWTPAVGMDVRVFVFLVYRVGCVLYVRLIVRVGMSYVVGVCLCYSNTTVQLNSEWLMAGRSGDRMPVLV
jgi:hypothetical protein